MCLEVGDFVRLEYQSNGYIHIYVFDPQSSVEVKAASPVTYYWLLLQGEMQFSNFPTPVISQGKCCGEWLQNFHGADFVPACVTVKCEEGVVECSSCGHWDHAQSLLVPIHSKLWRPILLIWEEKGGSHGPGLEAVSITLPDASVGGHITPSPACNRGRET